MYHWAVQELAELFLDSAHGWWERKSEPEFVMPLLKELNCKRSDSKLTQMSGLSSGTKEGLFLSLLLMHTKDKGAVDQLTEGQNHFQVIPLHMFL